MTTPETKPIKQRVAFSPETTCGGCGSRDWAVQSPGVWRCRQCSPRDWVREAIDQAHTEVAAVPTLRKLQIEAMIADVADGVRVLRVRDGLPVTDDMCRERAKNIVAGLIHTFNFQALS